ncbi:MAG: 6-phosphogluconolactonase [Burkholderiales bacterium]
MQTDIFATPDEVAKAAAQFIAGEARAAVERRGRFKFAVSGGRTPWQMLRALADCDVPWTNVHVFQVDERVAPDGDPDRNLTHIRDSLVAHVPLPPANLHPMRVEATDLDAAAASYARALATIAGTPPVLDLVHLGLGPDGHTASLVPGDPVLDEDHLAVALTQPYQGRRRMTLTYPILNRSRCVLFVVTGAEKIRALAKLRAGDASIPAGRITGERALIMADAAAAA